MKNTNAGSASSDINGAPGAMTQPSLGASIELAIADLVQREFSVEARIARAVKRHQPRKHLIRHLRLVKALEIAA